MRHIVLMIVIGVLAGAACGSEGSAVPGSAAVAIPKAREASADGAMCKEHGVLEAVCTKCNPSLIAVFRAKGDFCEEHGFPESICPVCHPEKGGKPSVDVGNAASDDAPADGTKIKLKTKETAARAGIETAQAVTELNGAVVSAVAKLAYDATKLARINARSPGVVQAIKVDIGATVKRGTPLAVIESPDVGADRSRLAAARARVSAAEENHGRQAALQGEGLTSRKALLAAEQALSDAKSELGVLAASLSVLGGSSGDTTGAGYVLTSPISGVVTQRSATIGEFVSTDKVLFEIVDTSTMWAELEINERDLGLVSIGQVVVLTFDGLARQALDGTLTYIAPSIDPHTRTAQARVALTNPTGALRANMYGQAKVAVGSAQSSVLVPRAAVQRAQDVHLVFVRIQDDQYETRRVELGHVQGDKIEIRKGVRANEQVVTTGSFLLKTETLKESIGAGCCEGE